MLAVDTSLKELIMSKRVKKDLCKRCATCCTYFAIPTDPPEDADDYDDLAWMLVHKDVTIHVMDEEWQIVVKNKCKYIDKEKGCLIYDQRPKICRDHVPGECDANAECEADYEGVESVITSLSELEGYRESQ